MVIKMEVNYQSHCIDGVSSFTMTVGELIKFLQKYDWPIRSTWINGIPL